MGVDEARDTVLRWLFLLWKLSQSDLNFGWQPHHKRDGWLLIWHARVHWSTLRFSPYMNISHNL